MPFNHTGFYWQEALHGFCSSLLATGLALVPADD